MTADSPFAMIAERTFTRYENDAADPRLKGGIARLILIALAFWPVGRWYVLRLNDGSDEPWGLIALGAASWCVRENWKLLRPKGRALAWMPVFLLGYAVLFPVLPAMVRPLLAIAMLAAAMDLPKRAPAALGLLILSLPVLATAQFYLGWPLRLTAAVFNDWLLNLAGVEAVRQGVVIWWRDIPVSVDPPCSGIRMLWAGLFVHFVLAAKHRLRFRTLLWLTPLVTMAIVGGNVARAFVLFFKESGMLTLPAWTHVGIGMAVFASMAAGMAWLYPRLRSSKPKNAPVSAGADSPDLLPLAVSAIIAGIVPLFSGEKGSTTTSAETFPGWPAEWEGNTLTEIPLSGQERAFARAFPGRVGVFETTGGERVILRWVTRPTRKIHSSEDCLRACGYSVENQPASKAAMAGWRRFSASHPDWGVFDLREQVRSTVDPARCWPEISAWFWAASFHRQLGPWWAITVMEPRES